MCALNVFTSLHIGLFAFSNVINPVVKIKFLVKKVTMFLEKSTLKKYDLQESYNNFKIKLKISFCE